MSKNVVWKGAAIAACAVSLWFIACGPTGPQTCSKDADCTSPERCSSGKCVEPVTPNPDAGGAGCTPGTTCRPKMGDCDFEEICNADATCPPDTMVMGGTVCRAPAGPCDLEERCTGTSPACPADALAPDTTVCRSSAGGCDPEEFCSGTDAQCPQDVLANAGDVCRPSAGDCDVEEKCAGGTAVCPADTFKDATTECRAATDLCDKAELCTGSAAACPDDGIRTNTEACRAAVNACDKTEFCDGANKTCPADAFEPANTPCGAATCTNGSAQPAQYCQGGGTTCVAPQPISCNGFQCSGAVCGTTCASSADCLSTHFCSGNLCSPKRPDGQSCTNAGTGYECASGICTASYADSDGDGYGAGIIDYFCGAAAPAGRSFLASDCCDSDNRAHPGQTAFFGTARACGGYDFNCDNLESRQYTFANACNVVGSCSSGSQECNGTTGWSATTVPACGTTSLYVTTCGSTSACNQSTCPDCSTCDATTQQRTQGCR